MLPWVDLLPCKPSHNLLSQLATAEVNSQSCKSLHISKSKLAIKFYFIHGNPIMYYSAVLLIGSVKASHVFSMNTGKCWGIQRKFAALDLNWTIL